MATNKNYMPHQLGLIAQIVLYLLPGIVIFLFLPSLIFSYFEDWDYSVAIYYSFVTLSTIGFGGNEFTKYSYFTLCTFVIMNKKLFNLSHNYNCFNFFMNVDWPLSHVPTQTQIMSQHLLHIRWINSA